MHVYDFLDEDAGVTGSKEQPDDEDPTLDSPGGRREEDDEDAGRKSPRPHGAYTIRLPGLRDVDWGW